MQYPDPKAMIAIAELNRAFKDKWFISMLWIPINDEETRNILLAKTRKEPEHYVVVSADKIESLILEAVFQLERSCPN